MTEFIACTTPKAIESIRFFISFPVKPELLAFKTIIRDIVEAINPTTGPVCVPAPGPTTTLVEFTVEALITYLAVAAATDDARGLSFDPDIPFEAALSIVFPVIVEAANGIFKHSKLKDWDEGVFL
jgi:hypothetical protein